MSEMPETIWVNINDSEDGCCPVEDEHFGDGRFYDPDTATEYRRADLPPTLSAAMELPEVKALVDAAWSVNHDNLHGNGLEGFRKNRDRLRVTLENLDAALAAIKEPKT